MEQFGRLQQNPDPTQTHTLSQTLLRNASTNKKIYALLIISVLLLGFNTYTSLTSHVPPLQASHPKSGFLIENLRGDTIDTWVAWNIWSTRVLNVQFVNPEALNQAQIDSIKNAILSEKSLQLDDSVVHIGPKGENSTYYAGWVGALKTVSGSQTKLIIPTTFLVSDSGKGEGDILFHFSKARNVDGYSGYTNSIVDKNQILKATIIIYDVANLTPEQIGIIARHEFGHAIGLAHSTAPEDLMAPIITTPYPYISQCDIDAIRLLYDGNQKSQALCEK
jgi:hypothetical protein